MNTWTAPARVEIDGESLTLRDVVRLARPTPHEPTARAVLHPAAATAARNSARLRERLTAERKPIYGVTTGFGDSVTQQISPERAARLQHHLIRYHLNGVGPNAPADVVRATLLIRANCLARGNSGIRPQVVERLLDHLDADILPLVPERGSLGASGDLVPLCYIAAALIGEGEAEVGKRVLAAPKALDDLVANTINIGELWARILSPADRALILINAPFAPAAYQFEKVLEYLQVMSLRPWVDNITGDYTRVLRLIRELKVNVFVGPPSRLLEMIQFAHRDDEPAPAFDTLLLMAEQTGPAFVRHLERLTGARAYVAAYGSSETGTTAVTCEHRGLHLQTQSYALEIADDTGARPVDGRPDRGELIVTTLDILARPLLRYRTGDLVEIAGVDCPCGVATPLLRTLGRSQDLITLEGSGIRQNDVESALWADGPADAGDLDAPRTPDAPRAPDAPPVLNAPLVLNYMLVIRDRTILCLVTTTGPADRHWTETTTARLAALFPGRELALRPVEKLPPLASLGQYLGWKLSRVLDLGDERNWDRLPAPIRGVVEETLAAYAPSTTDS
ncbi:hypothetical protein GCM10010387_23580 [Streptomyces inusitatus]|uniref:Uncharacterized protein n=1 Tax=Streptomyces inusitatus TaxID=68221 RepID=A0A918Q320_9ACTN|nr:aromatic amino acid lyase [Streptomyces inusitatus]GGZ29491.1 hypothetical protein GCM10010387_23580 [Streptomyces inusitatus]